MENTFLNEHLLPGQLGQFFIVLAWVSTLVASIVYTISAQSKLTFNQLIWKRSGNAFFSIHIVSTLSIFGILFYIIFKHYFEYHYVWAHSSTALPFKYLLSCFWEGQEGSFLLWSIWHCILSIFVLLYGGKWTSHVMAVVAGVQFLLTSAILGIHIGDIQIGTTPFMLLRDQMAGAPIFAQPNYLQLVKDGNGLNPLLQNYWMVIHPPILFLGFSATLFPFAYVVAILWKKDYTDFVAPLLRWSLLAAMVLGTGIMMGGAWAYESLNFGGYWAWDPVENASLVPWLVLIAAIHTTMIYKSTGYSLRATLLLFIFAFALVIYSTFLTRTGILGETSVHAFTGEGSSLFNHLLIWLFLVIGIGIFFFVKNYKILPKSPSTEESINSREFWMYIGSLILLISVLQITYTTSMPVWNKIFGTQLTITDPVMHYNKIQIWIVIFILMGTAVVYYLKFKNTQVKTAIKKMSIPFFIAIMLTSIISYLQQFTSVPIVLFSFAAIWAICSNLYFMVTVIKTKLIKWGGTLSHIGFGLMMLGIVISSYNKEVISINRLGVELPLGKKTKEENIKESTENVMLFRNVPIKMGNYYITYIGDTVAEPNHYYKVKYERKEELSGKVLESFVLKPNAQINPKMGLIASPDTKHYLSHDVFTYVTSTIDKSKITDTVSYQSQTVKIGDTLFFANGYMLFQKFATDTYNKNYQYNNGDIVVSALLDVYTLQGEKFTSTPTYYIRNQSENNIPDTIPALSLYIKLSKILPEKEAAIIEYKQPNFLDDYIIMKAIVFPYINVLWLGTIVMILGIGISLYKRIKQK